MDAVDFQSVRLETTTRRGSGEIHTFFRAGAEKKKQTLLLDGISMNVFVLFLHVSIFCRHGNKASDMAYLIDLAHLKEI